MRRVVLYLAISLDGFIADRNGGVDWLDGKPEAAQSSGSYSSFVEKVDTVIMGWNTYHQIVTELSPTEWPYPNLTSYVVTHKKIASTEQIIFTDENPCSLVKKLAKENGQDIWICGGANLVQQLIGENLIDRYQVSIIPTILGNGIPLFSPMNETLNLRLIKAHTDSGMVELIYERK